jgi:hypothetical protein
MSGLDDAYTKALLHMDGANASTTFTDESGKTWTAGGDAKISTAQSKFSGASFLANAGGISTPSSTDFDFGAGAFTIDFWVDSTQTTTLATLVARNNSNLGAAGEWSLLTSQTNAGDLAFYCYDYNAYVSPMLLTAGSLFNTGSWVHIALVRSSNDWTIYVGGVSKVTRNSNTTLAAVSRSLYVGNDQFFNRYYVGYLDEFRVSKGVARWTGNFTPPTGPYGPPQGTPVATAPFFMI